MGCCQSNEQVEEKQRNQEIDAQIKRDRVNLRKEIKMLLLGKRYFIFVCIILNICTHHHLF